MKNTEKISIFTAALLAAAGLFMIVFPGLNASLLLWISAAVITVSALVLALKAWKSKRGMDWVYALLAAVFALVLWMHRQEGASFVIFLFAFYLFFNGCVFLVQFILDLRERSRETWLDLCETVMFFGLCLICVAFRREDFTILMRLWGLYLMGQAAVILMETAYFRHPKGSRAYSWRLWPILPMYVVCVLPAMILRWFARDIRRGKSIAYDEYKKGYGKDDVDVRVFIHTGLTGAHLYGHMTFSVNDVMYSYGNYDTAEEKFFRSLGPGILFTVPAELYVNNSCVVEGSDLYEFGLKLSARQKKKLERLLASVMKKTFRWYCPLEKAGISEENFKKLEGDYASRLYFRTGSKYRKFYSGTWKNYWILGVNCSFFASHMLSRVIPDLHLNGAVSTPGEYFEFFTEQFEDPDSCVVYRSWHSALDPSTLYPTFD